MVVDGRMSDVGRRTQKRVRLRRTKLSERRSRWF